MFDLLTVSSLQVKKKTAELAYQYLYLINPKNTFNLAYKTFVVKS
jgi:hypothetical protein